MSDNKVTAAKPQTKEERTKGHSVRHSLKGGRGAYLYALEGDPLEVDGKTIPVLGAARIVGAMDIHVPAAAILTYFLLTFPSERMRHAAFKEAVL